MSRDLTGTLLVLFSTAGYAFFSIFAKMALGAGIRPFDLAVWRFILAAAIFWASYPLWRKWAQLSRLTRKDYAMMLLLGVVFAASALSALFALGTRLPASVYTLLVNTSPALIALISVVLGERLSLATWIAVGLALAGFALTMQGDFGGLTLNELMLPILNAVCIAIYVTLAARLTGHIPGITTGIFVITGTLITLLAVSPFFGLQVPPVGAWAPTFGLALFGTVIGIAAFLAGMNYIPAYLASMIQASGPPATLIFAALILGERLSVSQYAGGALILVSVVLAHQNRAKVRPETEAVAS